MFTPSFQKRLKCCVDQLKPPRTPTFQPAKMLQDARMSAMTSRTAASKVVAGCFHWARLVRSRDFAKYTICALLPLVQMASNGNSQPKADMGV